MKSGVLLLLLLLIDPPGKINQINSAKSEAKKAYLAGDFKTAIAQYKLLDSIGVKEDEITLNLAHSYFNLNDTANAQMAYQPLLSSNDSKIKSIAYQQTGVLLNRSKKPEEALVYLKNALKANPTNEEARYNYEMIKKKLEQKKKEEEQEKKNKQQEPSEFAKKLKAQADELVSQKLYKDAYNLMNDGLKKDQTVGHYQEFIKRTKEVAEIK